MKKKSTPKPRNPYVVPAKHRSGAGPQHDRRALRGGAHDTFREDLEEWETDKTPRPHKPTTSEGAPPAGDAPQD